MHLDELINNYIQLNQYRLLDGLNALKNLLNKIDALRETKYTRLAKLAKSTC